MTPRYQKIALDIANAIYKGQYIEGERLYGRSTLAGTYNVSPETIRRAIKLLEDVGVVESSKGSGITILSKDKAFKYINKFKNIESVASFKAILTSQIMKKRELEDEIVGTIEKIIERTSRFSNTRSITPLEIEVAGNCRLIGKSVGEVSFWQHTGATIVGIKRGDDTILSPGPYATFNSGDILLVIGEDTVYDAVKLFLEEE
jgi:K+/H+ antiporter YhaU regulatory subunit KhtT